MTSAFRHYLVLLSRYVRPQGWRVGVLVVTLVGSIVSHLILPQLIARFIDSAFTPQATDNLLNLALAYLGLAIVGQALNIAATYRASYVGWTATNALRADLAEHALHLDLSFHKSHTPGELIERVDGDVNTLTRFFSRFFIIVASNLLLMIGVVILLYRENWIAGTGALLFALLFLYLMLNLRDIAVPHYAEYRQPTCLVVSHRRAVLRRADYLLMLKEGRLEDERTPKDVLQRNEELLNLWEGEAR